MDRDLVLSEVVTRPETASPGTDQVWPRLSLVDFYGEPRVPDDHGGGEDSPFPPTISPTSPVSRSGEGDDLGVGSRRAPGDRRLGISEEGGLSLLSVSGTSGTPGHSSPFPRHSLFRRE